MAPGPRHPWVRALQRREEGEQGEGRGGAAGRGIRRSRECARGCAGSAAATGGGVQSVAVPTSAFVDLPPRRHSVARGASSAYARRGVRRRGLPHFGRLQKQIRDPAHFWYPYVVITMVGVSSDPGSREG